mgnify:FL=1
MTLDELIDLLNNLKSQYSGDMEVICEIHEEHCRTEVDIDDIIDVQYPNGDQKIVIWAVLEKS